MVTLSDVPAVRPKRKYSLAQRFRDELHQRDVQRQHDSRKRARQTAASTLCVVSRESELGDAVEEIKRIKRPKSESYAQTMLFTEENLVALPTVDISLRRKHRRMSHIDLSGPCPPHAHHDPALH